MQDIEKSEGKGPQLGGNNSVCCLGLIQMWASPAKHYKIENPRAKTEPALTLERCDPPLRMSLLNLQRVEHSAWACVSVFGFNSFSWHSAHPWPCFPLSLRVMRHFGCRFCSLRVFPWAAFACMISCTHFHLVEGLWLTAAWDQARNKPEGQLVVVGNAGFNPRAIG